MVSLRFILYPFLYISIINFNFFIFYSFILVVTIVESVMLKSPKRFNGPYRNWERIESVGCMLTIQDNRTGSLTL